MTSWGGGLFESDYVMDFVAGKMSDDLKINMNFINNPEHYNCDHSTQSKSTRGTRRHLDKKHFTRVFNVYKAADYVDHAKLIRGPQACVILAARAMKVGANISHEQREFLRTNYKNCGLYREGIEQMGKALDDYVTGTPYELVEPDRTDHNIQISFDEAREKATGARGLWDSAMAHCGPRYHEENIPSFDTKKAKNLRQKRLEKKEPPYFPGSAVLRECAGCGKLHDQVDVNLKACAGCKKVMYCDKECQKKDWAYHKKMCRRFAALPDAPVAESLPKSPMCMTGFDPLAGGLPASTPGANGWTFHAMPLFM